MPPLNFRYVIVRYCTVRTYGSYNYPLYDPHNYVLFVLHVQYSTLNLI